VILSLGERRFGSVAPAKFTKAIQGITSVQELEAMILRVGEVNSWEELLALPNKKTKRPRS
jgi:hypothetical protein